MKDKEKFWKIIAIISCSLLVIIVLSSFTPSITNEYYAICASLEELETQLSSIKSSLSDVSLSLSSISSSLSSISRTLRY